MVSISAKDAARTYPGHKETLLKDYLPYLLGALIAFAISSLLTLQETPQLMLFALLPAVGGALAERLSRHRADRF